MILDTWRAAVSGIKVSRYQGREADTPRDQVWQPKGMTIVTPIGVELRKESQLQADHLQADLYFKVWALGSGKGEEHYPIDTARSG